MLREVLVCAALVFAGCSGLARDPTVQSVGQLPHAARDVVALQTGSWILTLGGVEASGEPVRNSSWFRLATRSSSDAGSVGDVGEIQGWVWDGVHGTLFLNPVSSAWCLPDHQASGGCRFASGYRERWSSFSADPGNQIQHHSLQEGEAGAVRDAIFLTGPEKIFRIGGFDPEREGFSNAMSAYDFLKPGYVTWTSSGTFPVAIANATAVTVGEEGFVFGGETAEGRSRAVFRVSLRDGSVSLVDAEMPSAIGSLGVAAVPLGGSVLMFGGRDERGQPSDRIFRFDIRRAIFEAQRDRLPTARSHVGAVVADGAAWLFGGADSSGQPVAEVLRLDARPSIENSPPTGEIFTDVRTQDEEQWLVAWARVVDPDGGPVESFTWTWDADGNQTHGRFAGIPVSDGEQHTVRLTVRDAFGAETVIEKTATATPTGANL